jgi:hypothetical protein
VVAREGFFIRMTEQMFLQVVFTTERLGANFAVKRAFIGMYSEMATLRGGIFKHFVTDRALL